RSRAGSSRACWSAQGALAAREEGGRVPRSTCRGAVAPCGTRRRRAPRARTVHFYSSRFAANAVRAAQEAGASASDGEEIPSATSPLADVPPSMDYKCGTRATNAAAGLVKRTRLARIGCERRLMLQPGQSAPEFKLPDADMQTVDLASFIGRKRIVL